MGKDEARNLAGAREAARNLLAAIAEFMGLFARTCFLQKSARSITTCYLSTRRPSACSQIMRPCRFAILRLRSQPYTVFLNTLYRVISDPTLAEGYECSRRTRDASQPIAAGYASGRLGGPGPSCI